MPPDLLSVTQITTYLGCPRRYRFRYIERRESERKNADMAFGSAVHAGLAWWFDARVKGREPDETQVLRIFRADWKAQLLDDRLDLDGTPPEEYQVLGEALIRLFIERMGKELAPEKAESVFTVPMVDPRSGEELRLKLTGYIDFESPGLVGEIKTCARKTQASNWSLQLAAYSLAHRRVHGRKPTVRLVELIKTRDPKIEVLDMMIADRDELWFCEVASEVLSGIDAEAFFPIPGWMCATCEYRSACRGASRT